uniref:Tektin n=1 Tax=Macrostomum lignano TaxID=282301 RepID=A0A1I8I6C0_9PLAT
MTTKSSRATQHNLAGSHTDAHADNSLLHRLKEAIVQDNPTALMCIKTAAKDCSEEQWDRVFNQLNSRHQAYVCQKTEQHCNELRELQNTVRRNLATERRLLDEQLANHRSAIADDPGLATNRNTEERRNLCDHLAEPASLATEAQPIPNSGASVGSEADELARLHLALAAKERELALAENQLARSRHLCDSLLGRLTAAEAELQYLRNRSSNRRVSMIAVGGDEGDAAEQQAQTVAGDAAADSLRRSLADLERRRIIDTADALDLPGDPAELERRYDCLQVERREVEAALTRVPRTDSAHHTWHSVRDQELLEQKLDSIDRELVHLRNSLKHFHLI